MVVVVAVVVVLEIVVFKDVDRDWT